MRTQRINKAEKASWPTSVSNIVNVIRVLCFPTTAELVGCQVGSLAVGALFNSLRKPLSGKALGEILFPFVSLLLGHMVTLTKAGKSEGRVCRVLTAGVTR